VARLAGETLSCIWKTESYNLQAGKGRGTRTGSSAEVFFFTVGFMGISAPTKAFEHNTLCGS